MGPSGRITHVIGYIGDIEYIGLLGTGFMQVFYLGRAPRTKVTLPDFLKWRRVTRYPLVFRGLTGSQRTPRVWGVTLSIHILPIFLSYMHLFIRVFIYSYHLRILVIHSSLCIAFSGISYRITYPCMLCYALDSLYSLIILL